MAAGVEIRENLPNKGKGLFASKDYKKDDILFEEKPLVSTQFAWNTFYKYRACEYCMKSLETAEEMSQRLTESPELVLPYPKCCQVKREEHSACPHCQVEYCSQSCLQSAWGQYHRSLCLGAAVEDTEHPLNKLLESWRNIHYPPETCSIMLIAKMVATVRQAADKDSLLFQLNRFCKTTVNEEEEIAHKLLGKQFQDQLELLRTLAIEALYEERLDQWFTPEGFRSLFALIGTNGQGIGTSSISTWVKNCDSLALFGTEKEQLDGFIDQLYEDLDRVSAQFLNCEGSGLYTLQSTCNHSCRPNAEVAFPHNDFTLTVKALADIKEGEEICISYLDECDRERSRHSRQKHLRENYLFNCQCSLCLSQADDPDVTSEEEDEEDEEEDDGEEDHDQEPME